MKFRFLGLGLGSALQNPLVREGAPLRAAPSPPIDSPPTPQKNWLITISKPPKPTQIAERLYISGYLSYPRTESTAYPENFDMRAALEAQARALLGLVTCLGPSNPKPSNPKTSKPERNQATPKPTLTSNPGLCKRRP